MYLCLLSYWIYYYLMMFYYWNYYYCVNLCCYSLISTITYLTYYYSMIQNHALTMTHVAFVSPYLDFTGFILTDCIIKFAYRILWFLHFYLSMIILICLMLQDTIYKDVTHLPLLTLLKDTIYSLTQYPQQTSILFRNPRSVPPLST